MKKGLVLEGGAMRGLFSAGVMDVLMENGISRVSPKTQLQAYSLKHTIS